MGSPVNRMAEKKKAKKSPEKKEEGQVVVLIDENTKIKYTLPPGGKFSKEQLLRFIFHLLSFTEGVDISLLTAKLMERAQTKDVDSSRP